MATEAEQPGPLQINAYAVDRHVWVEVLNGENLKNSDRPINCAAPSVADAPPRIPADITFSTVFLQGNFIA